MPARVNYRLLSIVGLLVFIALVIVGGLLFLQLRSNVERNFRRAVEYQEAGDYKKAVGYYGRVVNKQPGHVEALGKLQEVHSKLKPETTEQAVKMYTRHLQIMHQGARHSLPDQAEAKMRALLEEYYLAASVTGEAGFWRGLQAITDEILANPMEENDLVARAYFLRGMAQLRLNDESLTSDIDGLGNIRFPGEDDFEKHIELVPDSDIGWAKLAFARMAVARRLGLESRFAQEERNLKLARETFAKAIELNPQGVWTVLEVLRDAYVEQLWYIGKNLRDPGSVSQEQIDEIRAEVAEAAAMAETVVMANAIDNEVAVLDMIRYMRLADPFDGEARSAVILQAALEEDPANDRYLFELARSQFAQQEFDEALAVAESLADSESKSVSLRARTQWGYRILAAKLAFDIEFEVWFTKEGLEREASVKAMRDAEAKLRSLVGGDDENPLLMEVEAKVAVADQDWSQASRLLERVITMQTPDSDLLRLTALCLERNGQIGLAVERYEQAIRAEPNDLRNYIGLAELNGRMRTPEKGIAILERLPRRIIEENEAASRVYQSLQILAGGVDNVPENISDPVLVALARADQVLQEDDPVGAEAVLQAARTAAESEDPRLLVALAHVSSLAGQTDQALEYMDIAIEAQPENERLRLLKIRYGDPVEGVKQYCIDRYSDPVERDAMIYENLRSLAQLRDRQAASLEAEEDLEGAAVQRQIAADARAAMEPYRVTAEQAVGTLSAAFIGRYEELLSDGKFDEARGLLAVAREKDFDQTQGNLAEARLELTMANQATIDGSDNSQMLIRGIAAAQRATEIAPWSDLAWRTLAWGHEQAGDLVNAERAYGESYRRNPASGPTLQKYVVLLLRPGGEPSRAVTILRDASTAFENDEMIRDLWLETEVKYGDPGIAYSIRKKEWDENPSNRSNALRLAAMLARSDPGPSLMLDESGQRLVNARQWLGLSSARQAELLGALQSQWDVLMDSILEEIEKNPDETFAESVLHASVHVDRQQVDEAVRVLRLYIDEQSEDQFRSDHTRSAAQFLIEANRIDEAVKMLEDALATQSADREIDAALGSVLYSRGLYTDAVPHLRVAVAASTEVALRHRLIESLLRTQQFEDGRQELEKLRSMGGSPYELAMLEAFLANREAVLAGATGDATTESEAMGRYRLKLKEALAVNPDQVRPYELLVSDLLDEYTRSQDKMILDEAVRVIDTASPAARQSQSVILLQADVQEARGNPRRAILDMESFLRANPEAAAVRQRLVDAHLSAGSPDRAKDTIEAAIVVDPTSASWHETLGTFLANEGDMEGATESYIKAFDLEPSRRLLARLNDATRTPEKWDHEGALSMAQRNQRLLDRDPILQTIHAKALARVGADAQAKARLRQARDSYLASIQQDLLPQQVLQEWYEDVQVVFAEDDPVAGESFTLGLIEGEPTIDDQAGLASYWSRWRSDDAWDKAIGYQQQAVKMAEAQSPDRVVEILGTLGNIQLAADREEDAMASFYRIVELTPDNTMSLNNYAYLLVSLQGKAEEALPFAEKAIRMEPENPAIIDTMATVQEGLGNYEAALVGRLNQLEYRPQDAELLAAIAMLYADHTDTPDKAVNFAERATGLQPRDAALMDVAGWAAFRAGRTAKGEDLILQSIRRQPSARAHLHLAEIYMAQDRVQKAREQLRLAVEIADDETTKAKAEELQGRLSSGG